MRNFAVSDIHGCSQTLKFLVEQRLFLQPQDHLFLLGDYINRGPDSEGVLDYIIQLQEAGYQLTVLRGNHDDRMASAVMERRFPITEKQWNLLTQMYSYTTYKDWIMVHAGLNFHTDDPLQDTYAMRWVRRDWEQDVDEDWLNGRRVLFGHIRRGRAAIEKAVQEQSAAVCIDNGCYDRATPGQGHLCAFNLDDESLIFQPNLDMPVATIDDEAYYYFVPY
ncbi:MAG: metallophosphoesterase [Bacteroidota bacterium]